MSLVCFLIALVLIGIDQATKYAVVEFVKPVGEIGVIKNFLELTYLENRGAAFGLFQNHRWLFISLTIVGVIAFILILFLYKRHNFFSYTAITLIIAGGVGNLIDRIAFGYVIDFVHFDFFGYIFNFADACITVGAIFLIIAIFTVDKKIKTDEYDLKHKAE